MSAAPLLQLDGVSKSHWRGLREVPVLRGVSLRIHAGELVAVWGARRSGKTTLLKLAAGLEQSDEGVVQVCGQDLEGLSPARYACVLREQIGWAKPTGPNDRGLCMVDYVALPLRRRHAHRQAMRIATSALAHVGVAECARQRWDSLSDSERALVAIAHALVREPRLLLVDDQTASLDDLEREDVMALLRSVAEERGIGVLATVPDMSDAVHAHRVCSLSSGRLLEPSEPAPAGGELHYLPRAQARRHGGASA